MGQTAAHGLLAKTLAMKTVQMAFSAFRDVRRMEARKKGRRITRQELQKRIYAVYNRERRLNIVHFTQCLFHAVLRVDFRWVMSLVVCNALCLLEEVNTGAFVVARGQVAQVQKGAE